MQRTSAPRPVRRPQNAQLELTDRMIRKRFHYAANPVDVLQVVSVDTTNHLAYCKRQGDQAAHNGYPYPYNPMTMSGVDSGNYTFSVSWAPTVGKNVVIKWTPTGPYVATQLSN
jgi:hypothetical protein